MYGPPITVNGKRPEWLTDGQWVSVIYTDGNGGGYAEKIPEQDWRETIIAVRVNADHPYYQSAEYKASEYQRINELLGNYNPLPVNFNDKEAQQSGTADREFFAGLFDVMGWPDTAANTRFGIYDCDWLSDAMQYLRDNKGRL